MRNVHKLFFEEQDIENQQFYKWADPNKYKQIVKIGQGEFGEVFKARDKNRANQFVAMKKVFIKSARPGLPISSQREIKILQLLKHENVINLIEICRTKDTTSILHSTTFYLVLDFCEHDLYRLLSNTLVMFTLGDIKSVLQQMLNGLSYIHSNKIAHRDLKPANILITKLGILKIADFGWSYPFGIANRFESQAVSLWYRPPEILLGDRYCGPAIDMWGVGCIMAEMWTRQAIMQGCTEKEQLVLISELCGSITPNVWPGVEELQSYRQAELPLGKMRKVYANFNYCIRDGGIDLLDNLLQLDPNGRIAAETALKHDFFSKTRCQAISVKCQRKTVMIQRKQTASKRKLA